MKFIVFHGFLKFADRRAIIFWTHWATQMQSMCDDCLRFFRTNDEEKLVSAINVKFSFYENKKCIKLRVIKRKFIGWCLKVFFVQHIYRGVQLNCEYSEWIFTKGYSRYTIDSQLSFLWFQIHFNDCVKLIKTFKNLLFVWV